MTALLDQAPSQAEIDREIAKLKEDSERDVERQVERERRDERRDEVEEDLKRAVEGGFAPIWKATEQEAEAVIKDVEGARERIE